jgi:acyl-CoA thioester hydrolase
MHSHSVRVYYEDTDFSGVVYHASYLRFLERGRTEFLRAAGVAQNALFAADPPLALAVRRMAIEFERPARMDDELAVTTRLVDIGGASLALDQEIRRGAERLVRAEAIVACIGAGRAVRLPAALRSALSAWLTPKSRVS